MKSIEIQTAIKEQLKVGNIIYCISDKGVKKECVIDKLGSKYMNANSMRIDLSIAKLCSDGSLKFNASYGHTFYVNPEMYDLEQESLLLKRAIYHKISASMNNDTIEIDKLRQIMDILNQ